MTDRQDELEKIERDAFYAHVFKMLMDEQFQNGKLDAGTYIEALANLDDLNIDFKNNQ